MKAKITRGRSFSGLVSYVCSENKGFEWVDGTIGNLEVDLTAVVEELEEPSRQRVGRKIEKPVWHCSLSLPEGEVIDRQKWREVVRAFLDKMGFGDHAWMAIRHRDTSHDHVHLILNRVSWGGEVWFGQWEARKAIAVTQKLEAEFGLQKTPGLGSNRAEKKKMSWKEINQGIREEQPPVRLQLQRLLDMVLDRKQSVTDFVLRLEAVGVQVVPNLGSTGRLNGFAFILDGVAMKGSDLGKAYTWQGLSKRGVIYEQNRDFEFLAKRRRRVTAGADGQGVGVCPGAGRSPDGAGRSPDGESRERERAAYATQSRASEYGGDGWGVTAEAASNTPKSPGSCTTKRYATKAVVGGGTGHAFVDVRSRNDSRPGHGHVSRRHKAGSDADQTIQPDYPARPSSQTIQQEYRRWKAKTVDPVPYLNFQGLQVTGRGRHRSVRRQGKELYRMTWKDGRWLWCDHSGERGGDLIDLVCELEGVGFIEAVERLASHTNPVSFTSSLTAGPTRPRWRTGTESDQEAGRDYLIRRRGIEPGVIEEAEQQGVLGYCPGGVLFLGRDSQGVRSATRRAIRDGDPVPKRDFLHSDKSFPPILRGQPEVVWVVEGGVDALALWTLAVSAGKKPPTVIVSGGVGVRSWLSNPEVMEILTRANRVILAGEVEGNRDKQEQTDGLRRRLLTELTSLAPQAQVQVWFPPQGKDLAEFLVCQHSRPPAQAERQGQGQPQPFPQRDLGWTR